MAELVVHDVEPALVAKLQQRADEHRRTIEDEHRSILRDALLPLNHESSAMTFEGYLRNMPEVGIDADFSRADGSIREVDLTE